MDRIVNQRSLQVLNYYANLNDTAELYSHRHEIHDREPSTRHREAARDQPLFRRILAYWTDSELLVSFVYLASLGILGGCLAILYSFIEENIVHLHNLLGGDPELSWVPPGPASFVAFVAHTVFFAGLAGATPKLLTPHGAGSGIPELKAILSGIILNKYLTFRMLLTKFFGLIFAAGGGLFTGREGPFVCLGACVAHLLCSLPVFRGKFLRNQRQHLSMLAVGAAVGIVSTFGSAIGGVLFSIETTATYYMVRDMWKCFFSSLVVSLLYAYVRFSGKVSAVEGTSFEQVRWTWEAGLFVGVGLLAGLSGAAFNLLVRRAGKAKKKWRWTRESRIGILCVWGLLVGAISYPLGPFLRNTFDESMNDLFTHESLAERRPEWFVAGAGSIVPALLLHASARLVLTALTVTLPIPTGIFVPSLTFGAGFGRAYGEALALLGATSIAPGIYALAGAAAACTGTTHSIAVAVILLEMTGQIYHLLHVLVAVLVAYGVTTSLSPSYYENALAAYNIPYMPLLRPASTKETAHDVMVREPMLQWLALDSPLSDVLESLRRNRDFHAFPLVLSTRSRRLVGVATRASLERALQEAGLVARGRGAGEADPTVTWQRFHDRFLRKVGVRDGPGPDAGLGPGSPPRVGPADAAAGVGEEREAPRSEGPRPPSGAANDLVEGADAPPVSPPGPPSATSRGALASFEEGGPLFPDDSPPEGPRRRPPGGGAGDEDPPSARPLGACSPKYDPAPLQISECTPLTKIHFYFTMLACNALYVTGPGGTLVGVLTKRILIAASMR
eukprot:tig00021493_g21902.t1